MLLKASESPFEFGVRYGCAGSLEGRPAPPDNIFKECKPFVQAPGAVPKESCPFGYPNLMKFKESYPVTPLERAKIGPKEWDTRKRFVDILLYELLHMYCSFHGFLENLPTTCFY